MAIRPNNFKAWESSSRMRTKGGYFPMNPMDSAQDMRGEMLSVMGEMGLDVEKHHHEVASAQHELGTKFQPLTMAADHMQIYKYVIHNVAADVRAFDDPRARFCVHLHAGVPEVLRDLRRHD